VVRSEQAVTAVFGKAGYALSWVARADRPAITPEQLRERFQTLPNRIKKLWAELTVVNEKAGSEQAARLLLFGPFPDCFYFFAGWT
jgi:hypothetical protein